MNNNSICKFWTVSFDQTLNFLFLYKRGIFTLLYYLPTLYTCQNNSHKDIEYKRNIFFLFFPSYIIQYRKIKYLLYVCIYSSVVVQLLVNASYPVWWLRGSDFTVTRTYPLPRSSKIASRFYFKEDRSFFSSLGLVPRVQERYVMLL